MGKTMEQKVAESILQQPETIAIGGKRYAVAKPSTATLIMASAAISKLPKFELKKETMVSDVLREAKDAEGIGEVIAIMILGAKGLEGDEKIIHKRRYLFGLINRDYEEVVHHDYKAELAKEILEELDAAELQRLAYLLFSKMNVGDFFGLIAFLSEVNMTKPTKATTTASGQQ